MAKASDNLFPKLLLTEGATPASPAAGNQGLFIDSADHKLKRVNASGTVTTIEGGPGGAATVQSGLLSARPAASTVVNGLYFATDDNGGTLYYSDGATWAAAAASVGVGGQELAYAQITSTFSMATVVETAVPGLSVTFTAPGTPVIVEFCAYMDCATVGETVGVHLSQDAYNPTASYILETGLIGGGADKYETVISKRRYTPSAGAHTISAYVMSNTTSTKRIVATPYVPAYLRVTTA